MLTNEDIDRIDRNAILYRHEPLRGLPMEISACQVEELVRMARRYAWLRDGVLVDGQINDDLYVAVDSAAWPGKWALIGEELDEAIDSAINSQRKEGGEG